MNPPEVVSVLNRLLHVLCRSLPMYLEDAKPWTRRDDEQAQRALADIVAEQRVLAANVAEAILEHRGRPDPGRFPIEFAATNDLTLDFLQQKLVEYQHRDLAAIRRCLAELESMPRLRPLAKKALAGAKTHLDILQEMTKHE